MTVKLLTLNIEDDRHLDRVRSVISAHVPDIVCLQEVLEADCPYLASAGDYQVTYAVSARLVGEPGFSSGRNWGIAVLTRLPVRQQTTAYYADDPRIRMLREPNDPRRVLIETQLEHSGQLYRIITTHFTWSPGGQISDQQRADFSRLKELLSIYPDYVLCGDFNAPRGREMFAKFTDELPLVDHLPADIQTTIDARFHQAGALNLVVDTIFSTHEYEVAELQVLDGISDHMGILAHINRRVGLVRSSKRHAGLERRREA